MLLRYLLPLTLLLIFSSASPQAGETVNPHWADEHCVECHPEEKPLGTGAPLKGGGDAVTICTRCHDGQAAAAEIHPYGVPLPDEVQKNSAFELPVVAGKITCLTCHDVLIQMGANRPGQLVNPLFLRQPFPHSPTDLCFTCHPRDDYRKRNAHLQVDQGGTIREETCLWCHQSLPDRQNKPTPAQIALRDKPTTLCISCHGGKQVNHPTSGDHLVSIPAEMREALTRETTDEGIDLPLLQNTITCTTCHNPHQRGVLERERAIAGAGEPYYLRVKKGRELCTRCHTGVKIPARHGSREGRIPARPEDTRQHEPFGEEKCKACHATSGYRGYKEEPVSSCFQNGCHEAGMLAHPFAHQERVLQSCTYCHSPHSSGYDKLLRCSEDNLCAGCHPLLRDGEGETLTADHEQLVAQTITREIPSEYECSFCHNPEHKGDFRAITSERCSDCHLYLRSTISKNIHREWADQSCSACHQPHTADHPYQLKEPPETYAR